VGESTAEKNKIQIGAAIEDLETPPEDMSVQGRDLLGETKTSRCFL
jgi:rod shape-determining protein MreB